MSYTIYFRILISVALIPFGVLGCTSLHQKVFDNVHEGDTKQHVLDVLGPPDSFGGSQRAPGAVAWYYKSGADICGVTIDEDKVKFEPRCMKDPNHKNAAAAFAKGFSDGFNGNRGVACTTTGNTTNCR